MTTNGKGVTKERLFAFVKETTALGKECGIVERAKAGKTGDSTASTYQRLAKSRLDLSSKDGGRLMVGVSAGLGTRRRAALRAVSAVLSPFLGDYARTANSRGNPGPQHRTQKTENKSPATRSRGLFFLENRTEPKHYRRP